MTTTRLLSFQHPGSWDRPEGYERARAVLKDAQRRCWWYRKTSVEGEPFQRLIINMVVSGRDQWWCYRRAMKLAVDCYVSMGLRATDVPDPVWEPLEPHMNRGRYRV